MKVLIYEKKDSLKKVDIVIFLSEWDLFLELNIVKGEKLGIVNNEMVVDELIKEKGIDIGDIIIDFVLKKEFIIVGFMKD